MRLNHLLTLGFLGLTLAACGGDDGDAESATIASINELRRVGGCTPPDPAEGDSGWSFSDSGFWYGDSGAWWSDSGGGGGADEELTAGDPEGFLRYCSSPALDDDIDGVLNADDPNCICGDPLRDDDQDGIGNAEDPYCVCWLGASPAGDADLDGSANSVDNDCDGDGLLETFNGATRGTTAAAPPGQPCVGRDPLDQAQGGCSGGSAGLLGLAMLIWVRPRRYRGGAR
jgi:hypothetical protein